MDPTLDPAELLAPALVAALRDAPAVAVAAIAGRDSIAAAIEAVRAHGVRTLLPTVVATGTEYGDDTAAERAVEQLRAVLETEADVLDVVRLGSPRLWHALNGRFGMVLRERFPGWSPCSACHLYVHLARVQLSWAVGTVPIITGERDAHGGRIKLSQTPAAIDAETRVLAHAGIELLTPIRHVHDSEVVAEILAGAFPGGVEAMRCVLSGNYLDLDGDVVFDEVADRRFATGFTESVGVAIVDAWRTDPEPDYVAIVRAALERG